MPNGLPLGFPIQVDSANRCYSNVNQSLHSCRHFREEFFNKISPFCEDMKNHQPSFLGLFFKLMFWGKGQWQQESFTGSPQKGNKDPVCPGLVCWGKGTKSALKRTSGNVDKNSHGYVHTCARGFKKCLLHSLPIQRSGQRFLACFSFKQILFTYTSLHYSQGPQPNPNSCFMPYPLFVTFWILEPQWQESRTTWHIK